MKKKLNNILKAFATGFTVVALTLLVLQFLSPITGFNIQTGWEDPNFINLDNKSAGIVYFSFVTPLLIGLIFALVQVFDDFETDISKLYKKVVRTEESNFILKTFSYALWGLAIGFVVSMFLFLLIFGTQGQFSIPLLFTANSTDSGVSGSTTLISIFTLLGFGYGSWKMSTSKAYHKLKKKHKKR